MMSQLTRLYNSEFYEQRHNNTLYSAQTILDYTLSQLYSIKSAIDFGCGVGTWLSVLQENNITVSGIDGPWVPQQYLKISVDDFHVYDIEKALDDRNSGLWNIPPADFLISLEVAEHIKASLADNFVDFIATHCQYALFSAAIPGQTGDGHVNEQWPSYWAAKFLNKGFLMLDVIRKNIWADDKIPFWYRQNCFLLIQMEKVDIDRYKNGDRVGRWSDIVHPEQFKFIYEMLSVPHVSLAQKIKNKFKR